MQTTAVLLSGPKDLSLDSIELNAPADGDVVIDITHSGISTGTEKLFWTGEMPPFPGMGYPLVPGYEAAGEIMQAPAESGFKVGDRVFVPGANCFGNVKGLFGGASRRIVTQAERAIRIDPELKAEGALLALAATARHAMAGLDKALPDLIVGHGTLGRLLARLTIAAGGPPPTVWEIDPDRQVSDGSYPVINPEADDKRDYDCIYDASGNGGLLNELISRICKGGEIVLVGFYAEPLSFAFPPAFMREARLRVASEWTAEDMVATRQLIECNALSLDGLITHRASAVRAESAYQQAFEDPACLKMILDWRDVA
ncbi:chlorophyll synthesis pathway protein BchC [Litoreibacter roseus]|uniref:2-desacetyl-2-hydroxyethyl bacteriochlorophyllide A dehydrogenase n=1 Tax=Litoreibacter roseus TaxID=2601869 RepID=A0A6N6JE38_9RHOB|nr:chlorophyll synthesis pathway protein BchC [Litoreibacter roseus]GFE64611.1 2-desacetyl-2-hydroxyethyl bacteriochlorophyllide A dehydrogenase [Litoreibacter roseus]